MTAIDISVALAELEDAKLSQYAARLRSLAAAGDEPGAVQLATALLGPSGSVGVVSDVVGDKAPRTAAAAAGGGRLGRLERRVEAHASANAQGLLGIGEDVADLAVRVDRIERLLRTQGRMIDFIVEPEIS